MRQSNAKVKSNRPLKITYPDLVKYWSEYIDNKSLDKLGAESFIQHIRNEKRGTKIEFNTTQVDKFVKQSIESLRKPHSFERPRETEKQYRNIQHEFNEPKPPLMELSAEFIEEHWIHFTRYKNIEMCYSIGFAQYLNHEARKKFGHGNFKRADWQQLVEFICQKRKEARQNKR